MGTGSQMMLTIKSIAKGTLLAGLLAGSTACATSVLWEPYISFPESALYEPDPEPERLHSNLAMDIAIRILLTPPFFAFDLVTMPIQTFIDDPFGVLLGEYSGDDDNCDT